MWLKWLPWKFIVRRMARNHGFLDPIAVLSYLRRFSQPSEVQEPIELLRAGMVMHARGLMNSRAIQHNLDWVWPYWVERQFNPNDVAFVPRAFSLTHINLTHRNWTAVGVPDVDHYPLVDPAGGVTPLMDGWTLDAWVLDADGELLIPSRIGPQSQRLVLDPNLAVVTETANEASALQSEAYARLEGDRVVCSIEWTGRTQGGGWLAIGLRPYNPEGVSFVHQVEKTEDGRAWKIEGRRLVEFMEPMERHAASDYHHGDVVLHLDEEQAWRDAVTCDVGMATAAALYRLEPGVERRVRVEVALPGGANTDDRECVETAEQRWGDALAGTCRIRLPDERMQFLYDAAIRTMILHSPGDVYPGPYTYRRFWFRDASVIIHAMLMAGMFDRCERALDRFPGRQTTFGYFHSQEGEWDSNGEALWVMNRFEKLSGRRKEDWNSPVLSGARWIARKRLATGRHELYGGLMPPGFSAEHLGTNDYYYWDDFWSVAGLRAASELLARAGMRTEARECLREAEDLQAAIDRSLAKAAARLGRPAMPAAPARRLDAGAIGSIVAGYPLQLLAPGDERLLDSVEWLLENCTQRGGFFQDMIHSGINAYLTLHLAQVLMRAGDARAGDLMRTVASLASPTGQWPEAIHPATGGGCMGDGQHVWAAAEWVAMLRNCFVLDEEAANKLVLGAGLLPEWLEPGVELELGPTPTPWGTIVVHVTTTGDRTEVTWEAEWRGEPPEIEVRMGDKGVVTVPAEYEAVQSGGGRI